MKLGEEKNQPIRFSTPAELDIHRKLLSCRKYFFTGSLCTLFTIPPDEILFFLSLASLSRLRARARVNLETQKWSRSLSWRGILSSGSPCLPFRALQREPTASRRRKSSLFAVPVLAAKYVASTRSRVRFCELPWAERISPRRRLPFSLSLSLPLRLDFLSQELLNRK